MPENLTAPAGVINTSEYKLSRWARFLRLALIALSLLVSTASFLSLQNAGLLAIYFHNRDGRSLFMHQAVEQHLQFSDLRLLLAPLVAHWDFEKADFPLEALEYRVVWKGGIAHENRNLPDATAREPGLWAAVYRKVRSPGKPDRLTVTPNVDLGELQLTERERMFRMRVDFEGFIRVAISGEYSFATTSDDGSVLLIDNRVVVDNSGEHPRAMRTGKVFLESGEHAFRLHYQNASFASELQASWTPPGEQEHEIPREAFTRLPSLPQALVVESDIAREVSVNSGTYSISEAAPAFAPLVPGLNALRLELQGSAMLAAAAPHHLRMRFRMPNGSFEEIPLSKVTPLPEIEPSAWSSKAIAWCALLIACALTLTALPQLARWICADARRKACAFAAGAAAITAVGWLLRWYQYAEIPFLFDTLDEVAAAWMGFNLLHIGQPLSWVWPETYDQVVYYKFFGRLEIFANYSFHPVPFLGLLSGGYASLMGTTKMFNIAPQDFRVPMLFISSLTITGVALLGKELYGRAAGLLAALVYATLPVLVLTGRLNKEDNVVALFAVFALYCAACFSKTKSSRSFLGMCFCCYLSALFKEVGIFACAGTALLLWRSGDRRSGNFRAGIMSGVAGLLGTLTFVAYGWMMNWTEFLHCFTSHVDYAPSITAVVELFGNVRFGDYPGSGWLIWLWICLFLLLRKGGEQLLAPVLAYLAVFTFISSGVWDGPWYRIPLYPFLCVAGGKILCDLLAKPSATPAVFFVLTALIATLQMLLFENVYFGASGSGVRPTLAILIACSGVFALPISYRYPRTLKAFTACLILAFIFANSYLSVELWRTYPGVIGGPLARSQG